MRRTLAALVVAIIASVALGLAGQAPYDVPGFDGYLVKLGPLGPGKTPDDVITRAVSTVLGSGWTATATDLALQYRIAPTDHGTAPGTVASAWSDVHRLQATGLLARAEPLLQTPTPAAQPAPTWSGECMPAWTGTGGQRINDDGALNDSRWSLGPRGANVVAAWELGAKGRGVIIGHPDTGYLNHPSINSAISGRGFNFPDRISIALDTADDGRLQWPGHGTRTASVIAGREFSISKYRISGAAPEALIMPLKVAHRVLLLDRIDTDMDNVARAIRAAALGSGNFVTRRADIISMSLGGTPSRAVADALALAEENNVIVLAAAGNAVPGRQVGFPARYGNVIAVAASNWDSGNWDLSSKGPAVAVTAPGQNVWTAKVRVVNGTTHYCIEPSSGTSYAVATTAGVAALWLSHHKATLANRPDLDLPRAFRALVSCTARPINVPDAEKPLYGGGIVDAAALLKEPLPDPDGPATGQSARCRQALILLPSRLRASLERCENLAALTAVLGDRNDAEALLFGAQPSPDACTRAGYLGDEIASLFVRELALTAAVHDFVSDRGAAGLIQLRRAILDLDLSSQLRRHLTVVDRCARSPEGWCT